MTSSPDRASIYDVAAAAGVSKSAASRALLGQPGVTDVVRELVQRTAQNLGYVKDLRAHALKSASTKTIGIVVRTVRLDFYAELIAEIQTQLEDSGYRVAFTGATNNPERAQETLTGLLGLRPEAIIIASGRISMKAIEAVGTQVPTTLIGPSSTSRIIGSVTDDGAGTVGLAKLVSEAGHRRVGVVTYPRNRSSTLSLRSQRLRRELARLGISADVIRCDPESDGPDESSLRALTGEVTAIMCPNDPTLVATWTLLDKWGISVPDDVALTGYDGIGQISNALFGLTTWRQDLPAMATAAVTQTLMRLDDPSSPPRHQGVEGRLLRGRTL
ncbi:LacI family DNA-binding transcriptional regulator [Subtercola sp. RTI3]|uniref:LacI family DNA-binding transcriptional regulator n=1 Tax=Subtercola sp. RTI3 TaxID=3048639 RepID=UPI002B235E79|nr:LacI family DNA-binding transcriptional regulator [Subtercola sp. RTI3]MEA9987055.1 LacI family DNA-binding transcriptional regulator [Subtercola sp. RTI3]